MKNRVVVVTGGAGFIGSNLCQELVALDCEVWSLDNYFTGSKDNHVDGVRYIEGDTTNIDSLIPVKPDIIYHMGEYSRVEQSFSDINVVWEYNKLGTFKVLEFCVKHDAKLIYAGSSTKFGDGGLGRSQSPYGWTKASNTELVKNFGDWFGLKYAVTYFYNVYGAREIKEGKYATLIALFAERMRRKKPLQVVSPGTQLRNFTHIEDVINALILIGENGVGDDYGIGSEESYSIMQIAEIFAGDIELIEARPGNRFSADLIVEKTQELGWRSERSVKDYIECLRKNSWIQ